MAIKKERAVSVYAPPKNGCLGYTPVRRANSYRGNCVLVQHEPNPHNHDDAANHLDSDVPEEVSHGVPFFQESAPQHFFYLFPIPLSKPLSYLHSSACSRSPQKIRQTQSSRSSPRASKLLLQSCLFLFRAPSFWHNLLNCGRIADGLL